MYNLRRNLITLMFAMASIVSMSVMNLASAATSEDLDKDSRQALQALYKAEPVAKTLSRTAKAVLVFPNIIKAGLVFGGSYGEGELIEGSKVVDEIARAKAPASIIVVDSPGGKLETVDLELETGAKLAATIAVVPPTLPAVWTRSIGLPAPPSASARKSSGIITPSKRSGALPITSASMSFQSSPASSSARSAASRTSPTCDTSIRLVSCCV